MPFITFSDRDLLFGKTVSEPAWYRVKIDSVGEKPSSDGGSTNFPVEATVIRNADNGSTDNAGIPVQWNFNSKAIGFAVGFLQSFGVEVKPGVRFDLQAAVGQELDVFVEHDTYNGRTINRVNHKYRPAA